MKGTGRKKRKLSLSGRERNEAASVAASIAKRVEENYSEEEIALAQATAERKYSFRRGLKAVWPKIRVLFFIAAHPSVWGLPVAVPAAVAVLYLVLPVDAVPDFLAGLGLLDDVFIITSMTAVIVKTVSSYSKERLLDIRKLCPEDLKETFDSMFGLESASPAAEDGEYKAVTPDEVTSVDKAVGSIEKGLRGTRKFINGMHDRLEEEAVKNPSLRNTRLYRMTDRANAYSEALGIEGKRLAVRALEDYLNLTLLKKTIISLISFTLFALALFFFAMKDTCFVFLLLSSLLMLLSYGFFIRSVIRTVPRAFHFARGFVKGGLEGGVVEFFYFVSKRDSALRDQLIRTGVRRIKNDRAVLKVILRNFSHTLVSFIVKICLLVVAFFALRRIVMYSTGLGTSFEILFAPFVECYRLFKR